MKLARPCAAWVGKMSRITAAYGRSRERRFACSRFALLARTELVVHGNEGGASCPPPPIELASLSLAEGAVGIRVRAGDG